MTLKPNKQKINEILTRGVEEILVKEDFERKLISGEKLRIKFGIDPTGNVLHLGHSVCLLKLRELQEMGHQIIFLIGDFTAKIGDPTGRTSKRVPLTEKQIKENMKSYKNQAGLILNLKKVETRYNSQWWNRMNLTEMMQLTMKVTYSQVSAREDFKKRLAEDKDFTVEEFMYPVLQGYDSVALKADVEIGGTDQKFNMLMGRQIQKKYNQKAQDVITIPLLEGLDGKEKMSKSIGNYIALTDKPEEMYGKVMSIQDGFIKKYFKFCTRLPLEKIDEIEKNLGSRDQKARLAKEIVKMYHGEKEAKNAEQEFDKVFRNKELPSDMPVFETDKKKYPILDLLCDSGLTHSKNEAKRLVEGNAVEIYNVKVNDWKASIELIDGAVIKVGSRRFAKIKIK
jgi:tyrosyl-tRNA synthetase